jgi:hypothetical protein
MPDSAYSEWLQAPERLVTLDDAAQGLRWGDGAEAVSASSVLDAEVATNAEAARQLAFKSGPLVEEEIILPKLIDVASVRGRVWTVSIDNDEAYQVGLPVFVLGGEALHQTGMTKLIILRKL